MTRLKLQSELRPAAIQAGIQRGRQLRSESMTRMVGSIFGLNAKDKRHA